MQGGLEKPHLIAFQTARLKADYRDFVEDERHARLASFFFGQVYTAGSTARRDAAFFKLRSFVADRLGKKLALRLDGLARLHEMTNRMDELLLEKMRTLGLDPDFSVEQYEEAYRLCSNYDDRMEQVRGLTEAMDFFWRLARAPMVGVWLKVAKRMARVVGAEDFVRFLDDGYESFRRVRSIDRFRRAIREREVARLDHIFGTTE